MIRTFKFLQRHLSLILFCLFLILNLFLLLQIFSNLNQHFLGYFFNSDSLYLPSIYKDLFEDHTGLKGWHLNAAPNFIPEWPLYFLVRYVCGDFRIALVAYSVLQFSLFTLLICWIYKIVSDRFSWFDFILINLNLSLFLTVYFYSNDVFFGCIFLPGYHNGAFILTLTSIALTFSYLKKSNARLPVLLFVIVIMATVSDRLYMVMYSIPLLFMFFISQGIEQRRKIFILSIGVITSSLAGLAVFRLIRLGDYIHFISLDWKLLNTRNIIPSIRIFAQQMQHMILGGGARSIIASVTILVALAGLWLVPRTIIRFVPIPRTKNKISLSLVQQFSFFSFCMIMCIILNPIANGSYISYAIFRYMIYAFYYAVSFAVFMLLTKTRGKNIPENTSAVVVVIIIGLIFAQLIINNSKNSNNSGLQKISSYYPDQVRDMDHVAGKYNLKYGIAGYWTAKKTTMFSKTSLRIYCVFDNLHPWYHVTNQNWYYDYSKGKFRHPEFNFIIGNSLDAGPDIKRIFQKEIDTIRYKDVVVYKVPRFEFDASKHEPVPVR